MNYQESIEYVKENNASAFCINKENKELFIIETNPGLHSDSDINIEYSIQDGDFGGAEHSFTPEEFVDEYQDELDNMEFTACRKDVSEMLNYLFSHVLENIDSYKIEE